MCRFAAYVGPELALEQFLLQPDHSLVKQAYQPREMRTALLNADGFGVGWYNGEAPASYRNPLPIWADHNLPALSRSLQRPLWLAYVRSATEGFGTGASNTQPFGDDELLFVHNGYVRDFAAGARARIRRWLQPDLEADVHGNTDSEYLFAALRQLMRDEDMSLDAGLRALCGLVAEWAEEQETLLNVAVTDGQRLYALRHALAADCPSLYYTCDDDFFPGGQLLASEPLTESEYWRAVPEHHLLILDPDEPPALLPI